MADLSPNSPALLKLAKNAHSAARWRTGTPPQIVLVDDDAAVLRLWEAVLQAEGYAVSSFADALAALDAIPNGCDLLITDYHMPHMTGSELIRAVKLRWQVPCVLITGSAGSEADRAGHEAGADHVVHKPTPIGVLLRLVDGLVRLRPTG